MTHVRTQIRDEVVTRLQAVGGLANRVQASRVYAVQQSPWVIVYTATEEAESVIESVPGISDRNLTLTVEIYSKAGSEVFDTQIDNISEAVEAALTTQAGAFLMCKTWKYTGLQVEYSPADKGSGVATLEFEFNYWVRENDPSTGV